MDADDALLFRTPTAEERALEVEIAVHEILHSTRTPMCGRTPLYDGAFRVALERVIRQEIAEDRYRRSWRRFFGGWPR